MPRSRRVAALAVAFVVVSLISFPASARSGARRQSPAGKAAKQTATPEPQSTILTDGISRELYDNDALFNQLSSAKQMVLERFFGPKTPRRTEPGQDTLPYPLNFASKTAVTNTLVNNPATDTNQFTQSETSCLVAGTNVVVAFNDSGSDTSGSNHFTGYALSTDGGTTFTDKGTLPTSTAGDAGDPVLARDNTTGAIYLVTLGFSSGNLIQFWKSTDNGATFGPPVNCTPGNRATDSMDKEWITVDNFAGTGQGNIYHFWRNFGGGTMGNGMRFTRSTDGGATWGPTRPWVTIEASAGQGAWPAVGPDHAVYCAWLSTGNVIKVRKSTDLGVTFGLAVTAYTVVSQGVNGDLGLSPGFRSNTFPQVVVNPTNANQIFMAVPDKGAGADKANVYLITSTDGGATWGAAVQVNDDATTTDQWQPSLAISPDGTKLFYGYYSRQNDPSNLMIDNYCRVGTVSGGGVAFGASQRISTVSFPAAFGHDPVVNGVYMGDYDHTTGDNSNFYHTWGDNRNRNFNNTQNQPDVYFAKISNATGPVAGADTPGVWDNTAATFFLRNSNSAGVADITVGYGVSGLVPIRGDWNNDGVDTIGLYDATSGAFFLRNSNTPGPADITFTFGAGGSLVPVTGDWNNDGTDTIGLYDPSSGTFFLRNSNSSGVADITFTFGAGGGTISAITGDWNGDGTDTIGIYDSSSGAFFLKNSNSSGAADLTFIFGAGAATPLAGDWNGDGTDTIGLYVGASSAFFLRNTNSPGVADVTYNYAGPNLTPIMGDWDGL